MECEKVKRLLPGYLDGAVMTGRWSDTHVSIGQHLERCDDCRDELRAYQAMSTMMSSLQHPVPPADMALRIRATPFRSRLVALCAPRANSRRAGPEKHPGTPGHSRDRRFRCCVRCICPGVSVARARCAAACGLK
jgi:hypothetical protein